MRFALVVAAAVVLAASARAEREAVLPQVRLPHGYYYREMYLPQATSSNTKAEREAVIARLSAARAVYASQAGSRP